MTDTAAQLLDVVRLVRGMGHTVVEVPGWETRGHRPMTTRGHLDHHTAGPNGGGDAPSLRVVTFGRAGLRNSLSRWYVDRRGVAYLVALRESWHAGVGVKGSNVTLSGTEGENTDAQPLTEATLATMAAIDAAEAIVFGYTADEVWDHKEHAPRRKVDRAGVDPDEWRRRVAAIINGEDDMSEAQYQTIIQVLDHTRDESVATRRIVSELVADRIAAHRASVGLAADPESDRYHVRLIAAGERTLAEALWLITEASKR